MIVPEADAARWAVQIAALLADPVRRMHLKERGGRARIIQRHAASEKTGDAAKLLAELEKLD